MHCVIHVADLIYLASTDTGISSVHPHFLSPSIKQTSICSYIIQINSVTCNLIISYQSSMDSQFVKDDDAIQKLGTSWEPLFGMLRIPVGTSFPIRRRHARFSTACVIPSRGYDWAKICKDVWSKNIKEKNWVIWISLLTDSPLHLVSFGQSMS